jgi:hypothetical protein
MGCIQGIHPGRLLEVANEIAQLTGAIVPSAPILLTFPDIGRGRQSS